jgi:hypothetical protein
MKATGYRSLSLSLKIISMIKIPYGLSHYPSLVEGGFHFVDKTPFIEKLEKLDARYLFFLRPRRFGKSLFVSVLHHYYGLEYKDKFPVLFGKYYIGQHPTPLANQYFVLSLEFSRIDSKTEESTYSGFLKNVKNSIADFFAAYKTFFSKKKQDEVLRETAPESMLKALFSLVSTNEPDRKIYLLIDEYDHFANEILAFRHQDFLNAVGQNGFVRKFYETIKTATGQGVVARIFITGVSPLTLDSMTSGFNISTSLTLNPHFEGMMGFTQAETEVILRGIVLPNDQFTAVFEDLQKWYDGYAFHWQGKEHFYNPDMVLYFADHYLQHGAYPEKMLDVNIASDYGKLRQLFRFGNREEANLRVMDALLTDESVAAMLTPQFNFERGFTRDDFISLLFYQGMLTVRGKQLDGWQFRIPNAVIRTLYFDYFAQILKERAALSDSMLDPSTVLYPFYLNNDPKPLLALVETTLKRLSNRDNVYFSEKHLKAIFAAFLNLSKAYLIKSEPEFERGYADLLLTRRPPIEAPFQFLIELKYLKKEEADKLDDTCQDARLQIRRYLATDEIKSLDHLKAWLFVFAGTELKLAEEQII